MMGRGPIGRATGYGHSRTIRRASMDSSIRNTNRTEIGFGIVGLAGFLIVLLGLLAFFGSF
jgi:hypothetical protein